MKRGKPLKRGQPLKAKKQLERGESKLERSKPIPKKNAKRRKRLHAEQFGPPEFGEFVRAYGCVVALQTGSLSECAGPVQQCHRKSRAAGGGWRNNNFGGCAKHHAEQGTVGIKTFEERHNLDLDLWCCAITHQFDLAHPDYAESA